MRSHRDWDGFFSPGHTSELTCFDSVFISHLLFKHFIFLTKTDFGMGSHKNIPGSGHGADRAKLIIDSKGRVALFQTFPHGLNSWLLG